jgi:succinate dehydrogenase/fumarate reductase cytochrome b subunit
MEPLFDKIARQAREIESTPLYGRITIFASVAVVVLIIVLYFVVAIYAYIDAKQKHTGVEFPAGRGFAACVFFGFSALFAYNVFAGLRSGVVTIGKNGSITIRRKTDTFVFYLAIAGLTAVSLWLFYHGIWSMFAI